MAIFEMDINQCYL